MSRIGKSSETEIRLVVAYGWRVEREQRETANVYKISFGDDDNVLTIRLW